MGKLDCMVKKLIPWIIIGIMAIVIILMLFRCTPEPGTTSITHDTIPGDPYPVLVEITKPVPYQVITPADTFWKDVDTATILQQCRELYKGYYTKNIYADTLKNDTSALVVVIDTVTQNHLQKRTMLFQNRRPTVINTTTTIYGEIPVNKFYLGAGLETNINPFFSKPNLTVNALLVLKKNWSYEAEVLFPLNNIKDIGVGFHAYYKLSFRKK